MLNKIATANAPAAIGPYSQAIQIGDLLLVSGQIPLSVDSGVLVGEDIKTQTKQVIENILAIVKASNFDPVNIAKCTCYLTDMKDFQSFNEVYELYFGEAVPGLPKGALVEISVICSI